MLRTNKEKPKDYMKKFEYLISRESEEQRPAYDPNCEHILFKFLESYSINKEKEKIYLNFIGKDQQPYCLVIPINKLRFFLRILGEIENRLENAKENS